MNNLQITSIIHSCPSVSRTFRGVYALDTLPPIVHRKPCSYICNLDPSYMSGSHWVCLYFPSRGLPEYFDSFGFPPPHPVAKLLGTSYRYNPYFLQYPLSTVCGQYCIFYLWQRSRVHSMTAILSLFDEHHLLWNDLFVNNVIECHFGVDLEVFDLDYVMEQTNLSYNQLTLI